MNIPFRKIGLLVLFALCANACGGPPSKTKEQVVQERLNERLATWRATTLDKCRMEVLDAAAAIVDSTLLTDARLKRDLSGLPNVPGRPTRPGFEAPEDTTPIAPLLQFILDSLLSDTTGRDSIY